MKEYKIEISQNAWEYTGHVIITANKVTKIGDCSIQADDITINFDEEVRIR